MQAENCCLKDGFIIFTYMLAEEYENTRQQVDFSTLPGQCYRGEIPGSGEVQKRLY